MRRALAALALVLAAAFPMPARAAGAAPVDWSDQSIYFVMTDRFKDGDPSKPPDPSASDPRGWKGGDLKGVIAELDYIKSLGMTAIWLTPVLEQVPCGEYVGIWMCGYHGYWTLDFYKVDPHLGDMATLQDLVRQAHAKGLRVILDVVINHVGYDHPWLTDPAHAGWFHDRCDINYYSQASVENCWLGGLPDLNTENPAVRAYLTDWALWLIDQTKVDGFRLDTARHIPKDFLAEWTAAIKRAHPGFWIVGEVFSSDYKYQAAYLDAGLDAVTDFQTYDGIKQGLDKRGDLSRLTWSPTLAANLMPGHETQRATFIDNHDVARFVGSTVPNADDLARLEQAVAYLYTMPGVPVLYYGTEVALAGGNDPDNRRVMPWDDSNAAVRELVTRVATARRDDPVLQRGTFKELESSGASLVYERVLGADAAVVAFNGSPIDALDLRLDHADVAAGRTLRPVLPGGDARATLGADGSLTVRLPPRGVQIWIAAAARSAPSGGDRPDLALGGLVALAGILLLGVGSILAGSRLIRLP